MSLIVKHQGVVHFTKDFGGGTVSDRRLLPGLDNCRVKVTDFKPKAGFTPGETIKHDEDEVVYIIQGRVQIESEGESSVLLPGDLYLAPAGTPTTFTALEDSRALCVFSQAGPEGPLPTDE